MIKSTRRENETRIFFFLLFLASRLKYVFNSYILAQLHNIFSIMLYLGLSTLKFQRVGQKIQNDEDDLSLWIIHCAVRRIHIIMSFRYLQYILY